MDEIQRVYGKKVLTEIKGSVGQFPLTNLQLSKNENKQHTCAFNQTKRTAMKFEGLETKHKDKSNSFWVILLNQTVGVEAGKFLGGFKRFLPNFLKPARTIFGPLLCEYFLITTVFGMTSKKRSCDFGTHFFQVKTRWTPFACIFREFAQIQRFCEGFHRFSRMLITCSGIFPGFSPNQNFWGRACTPCTQARRQDFAVGGDQKPQGGATFLKYNIGCMQQSGSQTWNGVALKSNGGGRAPWATPLATTLPAPRLNYM